MASLVAAFGDVVVSHEAARSRGRRDGEAGHGRWEDPAVPVQLGIDAGTEDREAQILCTEDSVVAMVGRTDGAEGGAAAVAAAYRLGRLAGLRSLRGEYAYALWDGSARALIIGCDAVGLRAPAYVWDGRVFRLSSQAVRLLGHPSAAPSWDEIYIAQTLSGLWCRAASATPFCGVRRMVGGEILHVSGRGLERLAGDRLTFSDSPVRSSREAARELGEVIDLVVGEHARASRRCCVALSGGIDSCVVASALAQRGALFDAFSLVAPTDSQGHDSALPAVVAALPTMRHHRVLLTGTEEATETDTPLPDDPICAGPAMQPGRLALIRAIRDAGFGQVLDGDGGDELFDLIWRPADVVRQPAFSLLRALASRGPRRRVLRDLLESGRGPIANLFHERALRRIRASRPWLRDTFWKSSSFALAWKEAVSLVRLPTARARLPEMLGGYGRYWRAQELARGRAGLAGVSPFLDRRVVEYVGALNAGVAVDLRHGKALLRRLAANRAPDPVAWRAKAEPLNDWLLDRWVRDDRNLASMLGRIKKSRLLAQYVDTAVVAAAFDQARQTVGPNRLAASVVELGTLVEWMAAAESRFAL